MNYAIRKDGQGWRAVDSAADCTADETWSATPPAAGAPTEQEIEAQAGAAVHKMLDELAQSWSYSSYISARAYKGDVSPKFDAEGTALANYGSACYTKLEQIKAGTIARPADLAGLLALMPPAPPRPVVS